MDNRKSGVKVIGVAHQLPLYTRDTAEIIPLLDTWLINQDERFRRKVKKIFGNAGVDRRYSILSPEEVFTATSFEEKNEVYAREMTNLGEKALQKALSDAQWAGTDLDYIITVSCTGIMIPSLDAYLINRLHLRQDIVRLPVTEMGCAAGISAMVYANDFLKANSGKRAAIIAVESPTATFQHTDFSMANVVSAAIFGDGAACVLLSSCEEDSGPVIKDTGMYHFYDAEHMMGFKLTNFGLKMILDKSVPETIAEHFPMVINPFLKQNNLEIHEIDHLIFHPGGRKIIETVEKLFGVFGKNINITKEVLRQFGNMSSVTVLIVLEEFLKSKVPPDEYGLMLSFGPGFSAQRILLQW